MPTNMAAKNDIVLGALRGVAPLGLAIIISYDMGYGNITAFLAYLNHITYWLVPLIPTKLSHFESLGVPTLITADALASSQARLGLGFRHL